MKKTMIGVTTYNRKRILELMSKSLYKSNLDISHVVRLYDDNSTEYSEKELGILFPTADKITVSRINKGADLNTWDMYCDFLNTDCDYLFNADSDLIFAKDWMRVGVEYIKNTDGILSIFNTPTHKSINEEGDLCLKNAFGAAGTFFSRKRIEELMQAFEKGDFSPERIDWGFCDYFNSIGLKLYSTRKSYVQHIGFRGYNSDETGFCYGKGFVVDSLHNGQAINDVLEELVETDQSRNESPGYFLFPFERVNKGERIVLYGAGRVGRDYYRQIEQTDYCEIVAVVDQSFDNKTVFQPKNIKDYDFDVIVIATTNHIYINEIVERIKKLCPRIERNRIIVAGEKKIRI